MTDHRNLTPGQRKRVAQGCAAPSRVARTRSARIEPLEPRRLFAIFALDPSFAEGGVFRGAVGASDFGAEIGYVDALDDGKILVAGEAVVARFNADGTRDTSYADGGMSEPVSLGGNVIAGVRQGDGKVVLVSDSGGNVSITAARVTAGGAADTAFGDGGMASVTVSTEGESLYVADVQLQTDGKIVIAGYRIRYDPDDENQRTVDTSGFLVRLNTDGSLDTSFGGSAAGGVVVVPLFSGELTGSQDEPNLDALAIDAQDRIFIGGGLTDQLYIARYTEDGAPDTTFSGDGRVEFRYQDNTPFFAGKLTDMLVQDDDGKIIVGGRGNDGGSGVIARFNPDGTFDTGFGGSIKPGVAGSTTTYYLGITHLARDSAGRYVGIGRDFPAVYRFTPDGQLDTTIGANGVTVLKPTAHHNTYFDGATGLDVDAQGRVLFGNFNGYLGRADFRADLELRDNGTLIVTGTGGNDTISFADSGANLAVTRNGVATSFSRLDVNRVDLLAGGGDDVVTSTADLDGLFSLGDGTNTITLADGDVTITAGAAEGQPAASLGNTITAGDGDMDIDAGAGGLLAHITVGNGNHLIYASDGGNDVITTGDGDNDINAYGGNDSITTGAGNDSIQGDNGDDTISSGAGDDLVSGGTGADTIDAGSGNDYCMAGQGEDEVDGGSVIVGGDGDDVLVGAGGRDSLYGGAGRDRLVGYSGPDLLSGGGGKDRLFGFGGKDRLYGGAANDRLDGGNHQDRLFGGDGNDIVLSLDASIDAIDGGPGSNILVESDDDDVLVNIETV